MKGFLLENSIPKCDLCLYLAADASCNVSHLDPVEFSDVQVFAIERLYLHFDTWKARLTVRAEQWLDTQRAGTRDGRGNLCGVTPLSQSGAGWLG